VDFAYAIHTDVGHQCVGARVNGRMVPLRTQLNNGDIVEIVRQAGHTPSRDWLNFVATSRARHKIRHFIHGEEKTRSVELGRRLLDKELRRFAVDRALASDEAIGRIAGEFSAQKVEDVLAGLGYGKITARALLTRLVGQEGLRERPGDGVPPVSPARRPPTGDDQKIKVRGVDDLMVFRARCCNPIRGEPIVGYITRGKGVSVHSATCPNVVNLLFDPDRRIDVEWDTGQDTPYTVRLKISVEDRRGILADVSSRIADIDTNIKDVEATVGVDHRGSIRMTVEISDLKHLERVMRSIRDVEGVLAVERAPR
jgi:GTP pyrophosphokinase